ncbi:MAG: hypothetical protein IAB19_04540 [Proteobacteria bacterium]|uniref:Uncharacterized protein n=1 Tax=Candidatus Avisuccinivibrio stercorigallinarum TaxID=2840704 RepID=A0A9D9DC10_9GAMM|nr:hypothetical protein [Candidatus Avisuccinivibrio stercorigallinarum]
MRSNAKQRALYQPELILLVAGYAANIFDPLCSQQLKVSGYYELQPQFWKL